MLLNTVDYITKCNKMHVQEHMPARSECDVISHQSSWINTLRYSYAALMHDVNEYQSQPVRTGGIISSLHDGTTEQMGNFV
jgi:hypothetical protein